MKKREKLVRWKISKDRIVGFTLTKLRYDLIVRIRQSLFFTLEECKVFLKEIILVITKDSEGDFRSLLTLSSLRNERYFPRKINEKYIEEEEEEVNSEDGSKKKKRKEKFRDGRKVRKLFNLIRDPRNTAISSTLYERKRRRILGIPLDEDMLKNEEDNLSEQKEEEDDEEEEEEEDISNSLFQELFFGKKKKKGGEEVQGEVDFPSIKMKLNNGQKSESLEVIGKKVNMMIKRINLHLIDVIDSAIRQRKERLRLSKTIIDELNEKKDTILLSGGKK